MTRGMDSARSGVTKRWVLVGHEHVGMQGTSLLVQGFAQPVKIGVVVFFRKEAWLAVVSALHNVQRHAIEVNPGASSHDPTIAEKPNLAPLIL